MSDFWVDFLLAVSGFLLILVAVYVPVVKGRIEAFKSQKQKISEYEDRLNKTGAYVLSLEKEVHRLRAELKKRTDQYNDLVDLAMEKGIIDK